MNSDGFCSFSSRLFRQIMLHKLLYCIVFISSFGDHHYCCPSSYTNLPFLSDGRNIKALFHDQPIKGDEISPSALNAIERSKISVVNLSKEYASSARCLDELAKIIECKNKTGQKVIPVFNQVHPLDVRNLTGDFGEKFSKLEERFKGNVEKTQTWRNALMEAADLPGFISDTIRSESELVEQIVGAILKILNANKFPSAVYNKDLVFADVYIPPPTLPPLQNDFPKINYDVYLSFSAEDTSKNFISYLYSSLIQKQISTCIDQNVIRGDEISPSVVNAIEGSKVAVVNLSKGYASSARCLNELVKIIEFKNTYGQLIVIPIFYQVDPYDVKNQAGNFGDEFSKLEERFKEDVEKLQKWRSALEEAANLPGFVSHGIRSDSLLVEIIVEHILRRLNNNLDKDLVGVESYLKDIEPLLDRNEQVLQDCGVKKTYEMKKLVDVDALMLFSWYAFGDDHPNKEEWESIINKLKGIPAIDVQKVLRVSYDGLDDKEKIACFLIGEDRDCAIKLLDPANGIFAEEGINVLIDKHLITISDSNKITMHNMLQEMGREIAWNDLGKRSRLRHQEDKSVNFEKMFVTTTFTLEIFSSVFEQLSSVHKPHFALASTSLSFAAVFLCVVELIYKGRREKVIWKWRRRTLFPWFYYPSETHDKHFGNFQDIVGLLCSVCQCILTSISFCFVHRHAENPIKVSAWPIIFTAGVLWSKFFVK